MLDDVNKVAHFLDEGYSQNPLHYEEPKVIRDPIWEFYKIDPPYLTILDSPFLQRLRFLSQTAFTISTYPTAQHSRFEHTLGVFHATKRVLDTVDEKLDRGIEENHWIETKLAALLHDIGHGPFSHASEEIYKHHDCFEDLDDRFLGPAKSEILSYCLIQSDPVQRLISDVSHQLDVDDIDSDRICDMILGNEDRLPEDYRFLRDIINGPFDADKFDYINRDGYFTGLNISLDVPRLLQGLEVSDDRSAILVDFKSLSALEQVYIARSQLYSQVYHHHKIRAAAVLIRRILSRLSRAKAKPHPTDLPGFTFDNPATYLSVDETHLLGYQWDDSTALRYIERLKKRDLPKRALVISNASLPETREGQGTDEEIEINANWQFLKNRLSDSPKFVEDEQSVISSHANSDGQVFIDVPPELPGDEDMDRPKIKLGRSDEDIRDMSNVFPADSWHSTYETYRQRIYILTDADDIPEITTGALEWLKNNEVKVKETAVKDAKIEIDDLDWDENDFL